MFDIHVLVYFVFVHLQCSMIHEVSCLNNSYSFVRSVKDALRAVFESLLKELIILDKLLTIAVTVLFMKNKVKCVHNEETVPLTDYELYPVLWQACFYFRKP